MQKYNEGVIDEFLNQMRYEGNEIHAVSVYHDGEPVLSKAFAPYKKDQLFPVWSVTKSFTSIAMGFLQEENSVDLDEPWLSFFTEYKDQATEGFEKVTLRHLLTMTMGQDSEAVIEHGDDWIANVVSKPVVHEPGTKFFYNSHCTYLIGRLIEKRTGMKLSEYLRTRLFEPLGIQHWYWDEDQEGHCIGGYGLHLRTQDLAKAGACVLENGMFEGKQIIPQEWLMEATKKQAETFGAYSLHKSESNRGYGYCFWMCSHDAYRMSGMYGQTCFILPEEHLVIALNASVEGSQVVVSHIFKALENSYGREKVTYAVPTVKGTDESPCLDWILGKHPAKENPAGITGIEITKKENGLKFVLEKNKEKYAFTAGYGKWYSQKDAFTEISRPGYPDILKEEGRVKNLYACAAFEQPDLLHAEIRREDLTAKYHLNFQIDRNWLKLDFHLEYMPSSFPKFTVFFPLK